jgi:hypothetical protein
MFDFITDLDNFFCAKYANYDKICILNGYKRPVMQTTRVNADGSTYSYTLPMERMTLADQENKETLLQELKSKLVDNTFSFSFVPYGFFKKIKVATAEYAFHRKLRGVLAKHNLTMQALGEELDISTEIWKNICLGKFAPTKNLVLTMSLVGQFTFEEAEELIIASGNIWDYSIAKDVVIAYLLQQQTYNPVMVEAALNEYKIENLFFKKQ